MCLGTLVCVNDTLASPVVVQSNRGLCLQVHLHMLVPRAPALPHHSQAPRNHMTPCPGVMPHMIMPHEWWSAHGHVPQLQAAPTCVGYPTPWVCVSQRPRRANQQHHNYAPLAVVSPPPHPSQPTGPGCRLTSPACSCGALATQQLAAKEGGAQTLPVASRYTVQLCVVVTGHLTSGAGGGLCGSPLGGDQCVCDGRCLGPQPLIHKRVPVASALAVTPHAPPADPVVRPQPLQQATAWQTTWGACTGR